MNRAIRRVAYVVVGLMLVIVGQLTYLQFIDAKTLQNDPRNSRTALRDVNRPRGEIVSADGEILARSTKVNDEYGWQRTYPFGSLYAQTVGYQSVVVGTVGLERSYDDDLTGRSFSRDLKRLPSLLADDRQTGTLVTTLRADAQAAARDALAGQRGSVTVLDPRTGAVLAMYSNPSFDPQPLASHDARRVQTYYDALQADPAHPALARAYREIYPPGSTFKVVTAASALDSGAVTIDTEFPGPACIDVDGQELCNFRRRDYGPHDFGYALVHSINTTFAQVGMDIGAEQLESTMRDFGFFRRIPWDYPPEQTLPSGIFNRRGDLVDPDTPVDIARLAIGQERLLATPLQMALVAAAVANGGQLVEPQPVQEVRAPDGAVVRRPQPVFLGRAMTTETAATLRTLMRQVVDDGTGTAANVAGLDIAGKTGTAETGTEEIGRAHV